MEEPIMTRSELEEMEELEKGELEEGTLSLSERIALERLRAKGSRAWRVCWPDFVEKDREGNVFLVEVKSQGSRLSEKQRKSFVKLENLGFRIKVMEVSRGEIRERRLGSCLNIPRRALTKSKSLKELKPPQDVSEKIFEILDRERPVSLSETER